MTVWKIVETWKFEYFDLEDDVPVLDTFNNFIKLWHRKRGYRLAPAWRDFQFEELSEWWGTMLIIDIQPEPFDFYYRLFGSVVADLLEFDATGKWATELAGSEYDLKDDMDFYQMLTRNPSLSYSHGTVHWQNRQHVGCSFVELPLSDDGETVTNLISVMVSGDRN